MIYILKDKKLKLPKIHKYDRIYKNNYKKIGNQLEKLYSKNKQILYIETIQEIDKETCYVDVYAADKNKKDLDAYQYYLFTIVSIEGFLEMDFVLDNFENTYNYYEDYSNKPYYCNRKFFINKKYLNRDDIYKATKYFIRENLKTFLLFNVKVNKIKET